tara:strand:+ start:5531 stop:5842 length:312 start_codon:yes stop_codon:yes gene_type:complete
MKEEEKKEIKHGKPWNVAATFNTYKEADQYRNEKISIWEKQNVEGMQAKVKRRRSDERFVVKIRLHPDFEPKRKEKKSGKRKNRNSRKGNTSKRKVQVVETSV